MKVKVTMIMLAAAMAVALPVCAQPKAHKSYDDFVRKANERYENFRDKANRKYADAIRRAWERYYGEEPVPLPVDTVPPRPIEEYQQASPIPVTTNEIVITNSIEYAPAVVQPKPVNPIEEIPEKDINRLIRFSGHGNPFETRYLRFYVYGSGMKVRDFPDFNLKSTRQKDIANAWDQLSGREFNNVIVDCLRLRDERNLCDWAFFRTVESLGLKKFEDRNKGMLFMAFVLTQCGYNLRLCVNETDNSLDIVFNFDNIIYNRSYYNINGAKYYPYLAADVRPLKICPAYFEGEQQMSMAAKVPDLITKSSAPRHMASTKYPEAVADVKVNSALMNFYSDYPPSATSNFLARWVYYANTPLCQEAQDVLYPMFRRITEGRDKLESLNVILDFCQKSLPYGYDDQIWGYDRAFFPDETIFYPLSDCEDHAILFARIVRDILDLPVLLIYYPGHLATAVAVEGALGDYVNHDDKQYFICDPTYWGSVGVSMPGMKTTQAQAIAVD